MVYQFFLWVSKFPRSCSFLSIGPYSFFFFIINRKSICTTVPWESFVMRRIQCKGKRKKKFWFWNSRSIWRNVLYTYYFHQIGGVKFIYDSHGQTFLSTLFAFYRTILSHDIARRPKLTIKINLSTLGNERLKQHLFGAFYRGNFNNSTLYDSKFGGGDATRTQNTHGRSTQTTVTNQIWHSGTSVETITHR